MLQGAFPDHTSHSAHPLKPDSVASSAGTHPTFTVSHPALNTLEGSLDLKEGCVCKWTCVSQSTCVGNNSKIVHHINSGWQLLSVNCPCRLRQLWAKVLLTASPSYPAAAAMGKRPNASARLSPCQPTQASLINKYLLSTYYLPDTGLSTTVVGMKIQTWVLQLYRYIITVEKKAIKDKGKILEGRLRNCSWLDSFIHFITMSTYIMFSSED